MNTIIIGLGGLDRRDDGAGIIAVRELRASELEIPFRESRGDPAELIQFWKDYPRVVIIDAMQSGRRAGSIKRLDASEKPLPAAYFPPFSSHIMSLTEAIELARVLGELPEKVIVYGIEGEDFSPAAGLTPPVAAAIDELKRMVLKEVQEEQLEMVSGEDA